mmetsp:Transcript_2286/g.6055  ORF Transcript_2286/g.6055 Transcript_2286/m.6055 type:complete len:112 (-) Transcript_2286:179-514(-)
MDQAERQKGSVGDLSDAKDRVELFALQLFQKADTEFRTGVATKNTLGKFRAACIIMEVLKQFGEMDEDIAQKYKFAKVWSARIYNDIKNGVQPLPPPALSEMGGANADCNP